MVCAHRSCLRPTEIYGMITSLEVSKGSKDLFLELYDEMVVQVVEQHPEMLRKLFWEGK